MKKMMILSLAMLGGLMVNCTHMKPAATLERLRAPVVALIEARVEHLAATDPTKARAVAVRAAAALMVLHDTKHALAAGGLEGDQHRRLIAAIIRNADELSAQLPDRPPWLEVALEAAVALTPDHAADDAAQTVNGLQLSTTDYAKWRDNLLRRLHLDPVSR